MFVQFEETKSILISNCYFENNKKPNGYILYVNKDSESRMSIINCVFSGKLINEARYINGNIMGNEKPKIFIESCNFDYDIKTAVNTDLLTYSSSLSFRVDSSFGFMKLVNKTWKMTVLGFASISVIIMNFS